MNFIPVARPVDGRAAQFAADLRACVLEGDDTRLTRLLGALLRVKGSTTGERVGLQVQALQKLLRALRSLALNDETTGLNNRRGFAQIGTRLLDLAVRDQRRIRLIYFRLAQLQSPAEQARVRDDAVLRQIGNLLRDLFPSYGVYEVLGRLSGDEFAALTPSAEYTTPNAILLRMQKPQRTGSLAAVPLLIGVAVFDPQQPVTLDELLRNAQRLMHAQRRAPPIASSGLTPHGMTHC
jgi:two-component system cell cycle response regulator